MKNKKRWVCERKPEIVYFKWAEFQFVFLYWWRFFSSFFGIDGVKKMRLLFGFFLAWQLKKKRRSGRCWSLLRQRVAGGWGRCVLLRRLSEATADGLVGEGRRRRSGRGQPCCCLSKKNAWTEREREKTKQNSDEQNTTWLLQKCSRFTQISIR